MSRFLKFHGVVWLLAVVMLIAVPTHKLQAQPNVNVTFQTFYNDLQPYGQWINNQQYGYCWVPNVTRGFRPYYTNGHWAMTEYGNTWVSNYSWGWAPFHYGNWTYDDYYGWIWVPGTTWGPAWVTWRNGGGNYGWAPIAPGVSITVAVGPRYSCANNWWTFVPQRHIYNRGFHNYCRSPRYNGAYLQQTTVINNTYYAGNNRRYVTGPSRTQIQRATGQQVRRYSINSGRKPGRTTVSGNSVNIYRPAVRRGSNERPARVAQTRSRSNAPTRGTQATQDRSTTQRATTTQRGQRKTPAAQNRSTRPQQATTMQRGQQRTHQATQQRNTNTQRSTPARQAQPARAQANRNVAQQQRQQQNQITKRRQQAWQNRSQPAQRAGSTQRPSSATTRSRANTPTQRNVQRTRPQSQSRPQQARTMQRSSSNSRSSAKQSRFSPSQSRATQSSSRSRSGASNRSRSGRR